MCKWLAVGVLLFSGSVHAETLYKCVGKRGVTSYQTDPCGPDQRIASRRDFVPEPPPTPEQRRAAYERQQRGKAESAYLSRLAGTSAAPRASGAVLQSSPNHSRCEMAKAERESVLRAVGLRRTYDLLSGLDEKVRAACK